MFQRTTAIDKLLALTKRKRVIQGGTWAGKTYGIIPVLTNKAIINPRKKITVVAESIPAIKQGALANFQEMMQDTQRWNDSQYNGTERTYTFLNGSTIQFTSFDTLSKAKAAGKRTDLFINEGQYIPFEIADALMMRTSEVTWIDFNPTEKFWAHDEVLVDADAEFLLLKYTDNESVPQSILDDLDKKLKKAYHNPFLPYEQRVRKENIKSFYWHNWCIVYIDGEVGTLEGVIFEPPRTVDAMPLTWKRKITWTDFGFTNHPTAIGQTAFSNGELYHQEFCYRTGMTNADIGDVYKSNGLIKGIDIIIADSAEPKSIADLRLLGWNVVGAEKGKGSVNAGIDLMKQFKHNVTASSRNIINEFRRYSWDIDKATGKHINVPVDAFNHTMDGIRYGVDYMVGRPVSKGVPRAMTTMPRKR